MESNGKPPEPKKDNSAVLSTRRRMEAGRTKKRLFVVIHIQPLVEAAVKDNPSFDIDREVLTRWISEHPEFFPEGMTFDQLNDLFDHSLNILRPLVGLPIRSTDAEKTEIAAKKKAETETTAQEIVQVLNTLIAPEIQRIPNYTLDMEALENLVIIYKKRFPPGVVSVKAILRHFGDSISKLNRAMKLPRGK